MSSKDNKATLRPKAKKPEKSKVAKVSSIAQAEAVAAPMQKSVKKKSIGAFITDLRGQIQESLSSRTEFTIADYVKAVELEREYKRTKTQSKREVVLRWEAFDPKKGL